MRYEQRRAIALQILTSSVPLTRKGGSFLGQCVVDASPLSERQHEWFGQLALKAGIDLEGAA